MNEMKNREKKNTNGKSLIFGLLLGVLCGLLFVVYGEHLRLGNLEKLAVIYLGIAGSMFLQTALHEAGHLIGGLMSGYRFISYQVFGLIWQRSSEGKIKMGLSKLPGAVGQCLMDPPELKDGKMPFVLNHLGGVLMNLITSCLAAGAAIWLMLSPRTVWTLSSLSWDGLVRQTVASGLVNHPLAQALLWMFAMIGLYMALVNGIPMRMGLIDNDGMHIRTLKKSDESVRALWAQLKIAAQDAQGVRLKDMPAEWFRMPSLEALKSGIGASLGAFACARRMDEGRFSEALAMRQALLDAKANFTGLHRAGILMEMVFCELMVGGKKEDAEKHLTQETRQVMESMKKSANTGISVLRLEHAIALLGEGDEEKAKKIEAQFEKNVKKLPLTGNVKNERDMMKYAKELFEKRKEENA